MLSLLCLPFFLNLCSSVSRNERQCRSTPLSQDWPSDSAWQALNKSIGGSLLSTTPVASSCWAGNPFGSTVSCNDSISEWSSSVFHASLPESMGATIFANNSCLPPGSSGYYKSRGCHLGGLPSYIVNATNEQQIATALRWASRRNIRIVVKGTGHELNGRSSGAYALSVWTRHLRTLKRDQNWRLSSTSQPSDVFIIGSGLGWGDVLDEALRQGRLVTTGQDGSVGPGGYIQGGGHGPIASTYGLGSQQVLQAHVVTTEGRILIANDLQNQDLFWAIRGGGGGQYGVVTEFVIKNFPAPSSVVTGVLSVAPLGNAGENASWDAATELFRNLPDLMDQGFAGAMTLSSGETAAKFNPALKNGTTGAAVTQVFWKFNTTITSFDAMLRPIIARIASHGGGSNTTLTLTYTSTAYANYSSFYSTISGSNTAGAGGISSSRLLGRRELVNIPFSTLTSYLQRASSAQNSTAGTFVTVGLSGGPGVMQAPAERWGALNPSWRSAYLHMLVGGASPEQGPERTPAETLAESAAWVEENKEALWREWAPEMGAYMNEANPYDGQWRRDFYGSSYEGLLRVKQRYDPTESLFVLSGVGSEGWRYDLQTGQLCRV